MKDLTTLRDLNFTQYVYITGTTEAKIYTESGKLRPLYQLKSVLTAVFSNNGNIEISGGCYVSATAISDTDAVTICAGNITITNSTVDVYASGTNTIGLCAVNDIYIDTMMRWSDSFHEAERSVSDVPARASNVSQTYCEKLPIFVEGEACNVKFLDAKASRKVRQAYKKGNLSI